MDMALKPLFTRNFAGRPLWQHAAFAVAIFLLIAGACFSVILNSDAYEIAKNFAVSHPKVIDALGGQTSARIGFGRLGFKLSEPYSSMRFPLAVSGQVANGAIAFEMTKREDGKWIVEKATFDSPRGQTVLVDAARPAGG